MNKASFFFITFFLTFKLFAQAETPKYQLAADQFKTFYNNNKPDSIFNHFSPELKIALPAENFKTSTSQLKSQLGPLLKTEFVKYDNKVAFYKATFQNEIFFLNISLNNKGQYTGLLLSPYQEAPKATTDPDVVESPVTLKTLSGTLSGTLAMPAKVSGKIPVILIISGSRTTDRDGNGPNLQTNDYKLLAEALAKKGIATLRYDKRMIGQSLTSEKENDLRFDNHIDDAYSFIDLLNNDQRFSKVIVLGHGDGSLIGMIASTNEAVKGFISVEGTALTAEKFLTALANDTYPKYIADGMKNVFDTLRRGKINYKVDPALYPIARPTLQGYILSWWRFDPPTEIKKLTIPYLIIQGTTDLQVDVTNGAKLKKGKLGTLVTIDNMNYVLKEAPADKEKNLATYTKPDLPLAPQLVPTIVEFVENLK